MGLLVAIFVYKNMNMNMSLHKKPEHDYWPRPFSILDSLFFHQFNECNCFKWTYPLLISLFSTSSISFLSPSLTASSPQLIVVINIIF